MAHLLNLITTSVSTENRIACDRCNRTRACDCYETVAVFLPNKPFRQAWRIYRWYARELRNMNMASFINRGDAVRLTFSPDISDITAKGFALPDQAIGLNHKKLWNGVTLVSPKRTKTRCLRPVWYSPTQCADTNGRRPEA